MANETLITDLVAQQALDQLDELDRKMEGTLAQFQDCARELARGIKIPVEVTGDLERLRELTNTTMQRAGQAAQQYTQQLQQQQQVIANTTNTISRQLMEQERLNKAQREAFTQQQQALDIADRILGSHEQNVRALARYKQQLEQLKAERKAGTITSEEYIRRELELKTAKQEVQKILNNETKMNQAAAGSYQQLSLQLERMKQAQKQLNEEQKRGAEGQALEKEIQELDAHLKDLAADMGEFQRNVGNYAIAGKNLRTELRELTMQMSQMLADGVDPTSEEFLKVAERAGQLKDAMSDANATIKDYANDTKGLTNTLSVMQTAMAGWQTVAGAMSAFGMESEDAAKATQKLMGIMSLMNGVQKISTELTTNGTGAYRAYHAILKLLGVETAAVTAATQAETVAAEANAVAETEVATATTAATASSGAHAAAAATETAAMGAATTAAIALRVALAALGVGAVITLIVTLYEAVKDFNKEGEKAAEICKGLNDAVKEGEKATAASAAELRYYKGVVDDFNGTAEQEKEIVDELNKKYGESIGYYESIAKWKGALAEIGEYYIDVLKWEAIAQANLNKYAEAHAEGNFAQADAYEENFKYYKQMAAKQSQVVQNLIKIRGASTTKPTTTKSGGRSTKTDNGGEEAETMMRKLINESNEMLDEWQKSATQRVLALESLITTTSVESYKVQLENVKAHYGVLESLIEDNRAKAIAEKQKEFDDAIEKAKKYGKDTTELEQARVTALTAIDNDYQSQITENREQMLDTQANMTSDLLDLITRETERNVSDITVVNAAKIEAIRESYLEELRAAGENEEKIAEIKRKYADMSLAHSKQTAIDVAKATVEGLEKALSIEELSSEERQQLAEKLAKAKVSYAKAVHDAEESELDSTTKKEKDAAEQRMKTTEDWVRKAGEAVQQVSEFMTSMYDNQISKIEELLEAEQQRYEQEVEHIDYLAERGAITTEEAEIRKRDAEAATAAKQEQLEKKKAAIEYKKAVMEKANSVAQIGIATALGIMQALAMWPPNIPLAAFVGAMGAIQVATALAQPIKAYAEGTKGKKHPGGLALVGDGNKAEVVMFDGQAWVTPDSPTLVDLPKGAEVLPDAAKAGIMGAVGNIPRDKVTGAPIIINDYSSLESRVAGNTKAVTRELRGIRFDMARQLKRQKFDAYIARRT